MDERRVSMPILAVRRGVAALIRAYQVAISPLFPRSCRFHPTCSSYALTSVERFGVVRGGWLAAKRIARCNPFNPGGFDPVPDTLHHARISRDRDAVR